VPANVPELNETVALPSARTPSSADRLPGLRCDSERAAAEMAADRLLTEGVRIIATTPTLALVTSRRRSHSGWWQPRLCLSCSISCDCALSVKSLTVPSITNAKRMIEYVALMV